MKDIAIDGLLLVNIIACGAAYSYDWGWGMLLLGGILFVVFAMRGTFNREGFNERGAHRPRWNQNSYHHQRGYWRR